MILTPEDLVALTGLKYRPMSPNGYEVMYVKCRHCGRRAEFPDSGNRFVGMQDRLRCSACGERGADLLRVWHVGRRPGLDPLDEPVVFLCALPNDRGRDLDTVRDHAELKV